MLKWNVPAIAQEALLLGVVEDLVLGGTKSFPKYCRQESPFGDILS